MLLQVLPLLCLVRLARPFRLHVLCRSPCSACLLQVLRLLRLIRLAKLFRILRAGHILQRWEVKLAINYSVVQLTKSIVVVMVCAHWLACGYHLVVILESSTVSWASLLAGGGEGLGHTAPSAGSTYGILWRAALQAWWLGELGANGW